MLMSDDNDNFIAHDWVFTVMELSVLLKVSLYSFELVASSDVVLLTTPSITGMKFGAYCSLFWPRTAHFDKNRPANQLEK